MVHKRTACISKLKGNVPVESCFQLVISFGLVTVKYVGIYCVLYDIWP